MSGKTIVELALAALGALVSISSACAQPSAPIPPSQQGWSLRTGAGFFMTPAYLGADNYQLGFLPDIKVSYADVFFASVQDGVGYRVINKNGFSLGPIARPGFGRPEDGGNPFRIAGALTDDLRGLGEINTTVELGGFAQYRKGPLTASVELRQAISGHDGLISDVNLRYRTSGRAFSKPVLITVGPSARFGDDTYNSAFFGVDPAQSAASGLPTFNAGAGVVQYGVGGTSVFVLSKRVAATLLLNYTRLGGDAADAPLVTERGSRNQVVTGLFLSYTWGGGPRR